MIQLAEKYQKMVQDILKQQITTQKVYAFGSRAKNTAKKYSDLDLCLVGELMSYSQLAELKDAFSESDLPYFVDVVQLKTMDQSFYAMVKKDFVEIVL